MDLNERLAAVAAEYQRLMLEAKIKKAEADLLASHLGLRSGDDGKPKKPKGKKTQLPKQAIIEAMNQIGRPCFTHEVATHIGAKRGTVSSALFLLKIAGSVTNSLSGVISSQGGRELVKWSLPEWTKDSTEPSAVPAQQSETFAA